MRINERSCWSGWNIDDWRGKYTALRRTRLHNVWLGSHGGWFWETPSEHPPHH